MSAGAELGQ